MAILEDAKKLAEKATGIARPRPRDLSALVRQRKAATFRFKDDGAVPNHPRWPLIHYRDCVRLVSAFDPAAIFEELFEQNGWDDSWRDGVYGYLHYHARIHEVMGVARGTAVVRFGGSRGRKLHLKAGDVIILPAGTGHQCLSASRDFLVVGAYPLTGEYDLCRPSAKTRERALRTVPKVPPPRKDPAYGRAGKLLQVWKRPIEEDQMAKKGKKRKYSKGASKEVENEMRRYKKGTAKSGKSGKGGKVKSRKQAIAIGLSKARKKGKKAPKKKS